MNNAGTDRLFCSFLNPVIKFGQGGNINIASWSSIHSCYVYIFEKIDEKFKLCWNSNEEPMKIGDIPERERFKCTYGFKRKQIYFCLFKTILLTSQELEQIENYGIGLLEFTPTGDGQIHIDNTILYWILMAEYLEQKCSNAMAFLEALYCIYGGTMISTNTANEIAALNWIKDNRLVLLPEQKLLDISQFIKGAWACVKGEVPLWAKTTGEAVNLAIDLKNNPGKYSMGNCYSETSAW